MTRNEFKAQVNGKLGEVLLRARLQSGKSISSLATALDLSERDLRNIEQRPVEVPCCELYQVIENYGPTARAAMEMALLDVYLWGAKHRASRSRARAALIKLYLECWRHRRVILVAILVRLAIDLLRYLV